MIMDAFVWAWSLTFVAVSLITLYLITDCLVQAFRIRDWTEVALMVFSYFMYFGFTYVLVISLIALGFFQ